MGNCFEPEDIGMAGIGNMAVGQNTNDISDELLSASLSGGGLKE